MSKGSKRRPGDEPKYRDGWERVFGPRVRGSRVPVVTTEQGHGARPEDSPLAILETGSLYFEQHLTPDGKWEWATKRSGP